MYDRLAHLDRASASGAEGGQFESGVCHNKLFKKNFNHEPHELMRTKETHTELELKVRQEHKGRILCQLYTHSYS